MMKETRQTETRFGYTSATVSKEIVQQLAAPIMSERVRPPALDRNVDEQALSRLMAREHVTFLD